MAKNKKIIRYKKPLNINVGMIMFAVIFVYLTFSVTTYFRRDRIQFYEVTEGSIVNDRSYTGLIFREELVGTAPQSGNINYYIREETGFCRSQNLFAGRDGTAGKIFGRASGELCRSFSGKSI